MSLGSMVESIGNSVIGFSQASMEATQAYAKKMSYKDAEGRKSYALAHNIIGARASAAILTAIPGFVIQKIGRGLQKIGL